MALKDLFRPRWKHPNPLKRRATVQRLIDRAKGVDELNRVVVLIGLMKTPEALAGLVQLVREAEGDPRLSAGDEFSYDGWKFCRRVADEIAKFGSAAVEPCGELLRSPGGAEGHLGLRVGSGTVRGYNHRETAAYILGRLGDQAAVPHLAEALDRKFPQLGGDAEFGESSVVVKTAITALGVLGGHEAAKAIQDYLVQNRHELKPHELRLVDGWPEQLGAIAAVERSLVVGRSGTSQATSGFFGLHDRCVSRQHARFTLEGNTVTVTDIGSRSGTSVNGRQVGTRILNDGDEIRLGSSRLVYRKLDTALGLVAVRDAD